MTNTTKGLLTKKDAARFGRAVKAVAEEGLVAGSARPKMYIRYEPLVVAKAGLEATLMHAGRSSQDIHATFQRAILRESSAQWRNCHKSASGLYESDLPGLRTLRSEESSDTGKVQMPVLRAYG